MAFRGGGTAGGGIPSKAAPEYVRQVPKFLQKYQHMMGRPAGDGGSDDPAGTQQKIGELQAERMRSQAAQDAFEDELQGATVVADESGLGLDGEDASVLLEDPGWLKDQGNAAFSRGEHDEAVSYFTKAIRQDPSNAVLYSNRSAAHAALKQFDLALQDGKKALQLQPRWPKAYSRIGAAYFGLGQYDDAMRSYEKGVQCDPKNDVCINGAKQARERLLKVEEKEAASGKHVFKKRKPEDVAGSRSSKQRQRHNVAVSRKEPVRKDSAREKDSAGPRLSFLEEEEEG